MGMGIKDKVIKAKPWQIFLVFIGVMVVYAITPEYPDLLKPLAAILFASIILGWFMVLGVSLNDNLPESEQKSDTFFLVNGVYGVLMITLSELFKDMHMGEEMSVIVLVSGLYFLFSFFHIIYFTSIQFHKNQQIYLDDKDKLSGESIFVLFIVFIIGILFLQPRVKRFFNR